MEIVDLEKILDPENIDIDTKDLKGAENIKDILTSADSLNYQKILSAMPSWVKLSATDKNAVNAELMNKVGKKYQRLLQEAQKFSMNAGKYTPVNTSTNTNVTIYSWLCTMSLGALVFVLKHLRKQDW